MATSPQEPVEETPSVKIQEKKSSKKPPKKDKAVPRNAAVQKALKAAKKVKETPYEKYGMNEKGVTPITTSRQGLMDIAKNQKGGELLIRKTPIPALGTRNLCKGCARGI